MGSFDENIIKKIFCDILGIPEEKVTDRLTYNSCEQWDSLKHLQLVSRIEKVFNIEIEMDDIIAMENYGKAKEIIQKYLM